jgi:hypothetical protein
MRSEHADVIDSTGSKNSILASARTKLILPAIVEPNDNLRPDLVEDVIAAWHNRKLSMNSNGSRCASH